jgi:hypothetical protein
VQSIYLSKKQIDDLVDEVWRDGYTIPDVDRIYGLRKLRLLLTITVEQTKNFPVLDIGKNFDDLLDEVERILNIIEDTASECNEENDGTGVDGELESLVEMADDLKACMEEFGDFDDSKFSKAQRNASDNIDLSITSEIWNVIGVLKGYDNYSNELGEKWNPNTTPASNNPALCTEIYNRAVNVALADWANPNERCSAITIALAITVSPDVVFVSDNIVEKGLPRFNVEYRGIRAYLSPGQGSKSFSSLPMLWEQDGNRMVQKITHLKNLAQTYDDHNNDVKAREFLGKFLPKTSSVTDKAAVLALSWAILQRLIVEDSCPGYAIDLSDNRKPIPYDFEYKSRDLDVWIGLRKDEIVSSHFP